MNNELDDSCSAFAARTTWKSLSGPSGPEMTPVIEELMSQSLLALDVQVLRQLSHTMADEVAPETRVGTLLEAAIHGTAATWGVIAVMRDGAWEGAASATAAPAPPAPHGERLPADRLPVPIIAAAVHLRDGLVLRDACAADHWRTDDYVRRRKPRSVMCVPIRCNGALMGALYLEHGDLPGIFTLAKAALVEILALHAGFVLDNQRLHDALAARQARADSIAARIGDTPSDADCAERLKAYGELAASIVHEVAQPITAIDTSARAGLKWLDRGTPNLDAARAMFAHICACAERARTIIRALRANARHETPAFATFDLADALSEAAEIMASTLDAMKVSLRVDGLASPLPMRGERIQLQQAVIGLLMNGAESMLCIPEERRVLVLACEAAQDGLRIRIDDNGDGIDPRLAQRIFDPLFTTKPHGMGMGLSICKSIVDAHDGQLVLTPRVEGGTRAMMTLPRFPVSGTAAAHQAA
ncbi:MULTISPECIES: ATP-binding protein [unclassified Burkholderia]|uniref:GAF domain-containing sensor histidine kinase n=1 Tax=unclassified Burkholderia TaxID=2613784 RepID=UPI001E3AFD11|nr:MULTISPECIES: ATP-binding protein [unclassified Burkholderia]UEP32637.1 GAF domain-containing protein [Burkholderia sp. B21-007]UEP46304.1 GAF domain-containing protein [Burkholderia sp. B21-005]